MPFKLRNNTALAPQQPHAEYTSNAERNFVLFHYLVYTRHGIKLDDGVLLVNTANNQPASYRKADKRKTRISGEHLKSTTIKFSE